MDIRKLEKEELEELHEAVLLPRPRQGDAARGGRGDGASVTGSTVDACPRGRSSPTVIPSSKAARAAPMHPRADYSKKIDAPTWLWHSVVDLAGIHESAYLEHSRRHAAA